MFKCPSCHEETISKSTKFWMGPVRSKECSNCGAEVSIPFESLFGLTLFIIILFLIVVYSKTMTSLVVLTLIALIVYGYGFYKFVPLIAKPKDRHAKYHLKNVTIMVVYFVLTMILYMNVMSPSIYFYRHEVVEDLSLIQDRLDQLSPYLSYEDTSVLDRELDLAHEDLLDILDNKKGRYRLRNYVSVYPILGQIRDLAYDSSDAHEKQVLTEIIELGHTYKDMRDVSSYEFSLEFNMYKAMPESLKEYVIQLREIAFK